MAASGRRGRSPIGEREVAGHIHRHVTWCGNELRLFGGALLGIPELLTEPASGAEAAAGWWRDRRRNLAFKDESIFGVMRLNLRHRRDERDGVRVLRLGEDTLHRANFNNLAEVHHSDAVREIADDIKVVADEEVGEALLVA